MRGLEWRECILYTFANICNASKTREREFGTRLTKGRMPDLLLPLPLDFGGTDTERAVGKLSARDVLCHYAVETEDDRSLK